MTSLLTTEDIMHAITEDGLEPPDLLSWKHWQTWRAGDGRRPAVRRGDAVSTTIAQESAIWRAVMEAVHGPDWYAELRGGAGQPNGSQLDGSQIDGSQVEAGADDVPAAEIAQERQSAAELKGLSVRQRFRMVVPARLPCGSGRWYPSILVSRRRCSSSAISAGLQLCWTILAN